MRVRIEDGFTVVDGIRRFDHESAQRFAAEVTSRINDNLPQYVIIDFTGNKGIFSAAIVELVCLDDVLRLHNGLMALTGLSQEAATALSVAKLDGFFLIASDVPSAGQLLRQEMEV